MCAITSRPVVSTGAASAHAPPFLQHHKLVPQHQGLCLGTRKCPITILMWVLCPNFVPHHQRIPGYRPEHIYLLRGRGTFVTILGE